MSFSAMKRRVRVRVQVVRPVCMVGGRSFVLGGTIPVNWSASGDQNVGERSEALKLLLGTRWRSRTCKAIELVVVVAGHCRDIFGWWLLVGAGIQFSSPE